MIQIDMSTYQPLNGGTPPPQPASPPPGAGPSVDMSTYQPLSSAPQQAPPDLAQNPRGEGVYHMTGPVGHQAGVPYSKVATAQSQGYNFADDGELKRYTQDYAASPHKSLMDAITSGGLPPGVLAGAAKAAGQTITGGADLLDKLSGHPRIDVGAHPNQTLDKVKQWVDSGPQGFGENVGAAAENVGEFMTGEGALSEMAKVAKGTELLKDAAQLSKVLDKYPTLARALHLGLKQGAVGGAQTLVKTGGDTGQAAQAAALTGAAGGATSLIGSGLGALKDSIAKRAADLLGRTDELDGKQVILPKQPSPTPEQAAGQAELQRSAQSTLAGHLEEVNEGRTANEQRALPSSTSGPRFTLRGNPVTDTSTTDVVRAAPFPKENIKGSMTDPTGSGQRIPRNMSPQENLPHMTSAEVPGSPGRSTSTASAGSSGADISTASPQQPGQGHIEGPGTFITDDPDIARAHLKNLREVMQHPEFGTLDAETQQQLTEAHNDTARQLRSYDQQQAGAWRANQPPRELVNIPATTQAIGSHSEAADRLMQITQDGYTRIEDAAQLHGDSAGMYNTLRNANKEAWAKVTDATTKDALTNAEGEVHRTNQQMEDFLHQIGDPVSVKELAQINNSYGDALKLKQIGGEIDGAFNRNPYLSKDSRLYRGFSGAKLDQSLSGLTQKYGYSELQRLLGRDNLQTLQKVADLNQTAQGADQFGAAVSNIGRWLNKVGLPGLRMGAVAAGGTFAHSAGIPWWIGAGAGAGSAEGLAATSRLVWNKIATNPRIAHQVLFAIESGARAGNYGPFIGQLIASEVSRANSTPEDNKQ